MEQYLKVSEFQNVGSFARLDTECPCGKRHQVPVAHIITGPGALDGLQEALREFSGKNALLVADTHTWPLAGDTVKSIAEGAGLCVRVYVLSRREHYLTNEEAIGEVFVHLPQDTDLILAVGSGTINDISRAVSVRRRMPYFIIGTAPSMDGYASSVSAIICGDEKVSVPLGAPYGIVMDTRLLVTAPEEMLSAGIGDVMGKYVALADWRLAAREGREHYCSEISDLIEAACRRCQAGFRGVIARDPAAVGDMADTLVMSGAAISMFGTSRPCAGSEHQLAHSWEVALMHEAYNPLHGNFVGLGTIAAIHLYREAAEEIGFADLHYELPEAGEIEAILRAAGGWALKERLGVTRQMFFDGFENAVLTNPRYTLLTYLYDRGRLAHYAEKVTDRVYGG